MQVYGEDFQDFMHRGATQCTSCHAYVDLFCYQAPSSRCMLLWNHMHDFRLSSLDFGQPLASL